jgi:hypothetical protein
MLPVRRPRRPRLRTAATLTSLALCLVPAILWLRCEGTGSDELELYGFRGFGICSLDRALFFGTFPYPHARETWSPLIRVRRDHGDSAGMWSYVVVYEHGRHAAGIGYGSVDLNEPEMLRSSIRVLMIPHAYVGILFALLPAAAATRALRRRQRRRLRQQSGLCPHCGYDLRATPTRCPECGATPARHHDNPSLAAQYRPPCDSPPPPSS